MKNNLFKKSTSVFLAVLMLLSCWVWMPGMEEHNHASAASYQATTAAQQTNWNLVNGISVNKATPVTVNGSFAGDTTYGDMGNYYKNVIYSPHLDAEIDEGTSQNVLYYFGSAGSNYYASHVDMYHANTVMVATNAVPNPQTGVVVYHGGYRSGYGSYKDICLQAIYPSDTALSSIGSSYAINGVWNGAGNTAQLFEFTDYWKGVGGTVDFAWLIHQGNYLCYQENNLIDNMWRTSNDKSTYGNLIRWKGTFGTDQYSVMIYPVYGVRSWVSGYQSSTSADRDLSQSNSMLAVLNYAPVENAIDKFNSIKNTITQANAGQYSTQSIRELVRIGNLLNAANPAKFINATTASGSIMNQVTAYSNAAKAAVDAVNGFTLEKRKVELTFDNMFSFTDWTNSSSSTSARATLTINENAGTVTFKGTGANADIYTNHNGAGGRGTNSAYYAIPVKGGENYTFTYTVDAASNGTQFHVFWFTENGGAYTDTSITGGSAGWFTGESTGGTSGKGVMTKTMTAPSDAAYAEIRIGTTGSATATATISKIGFYQTSRAAMAANSCVTHPRRKVYTYGTAIGTAYPTAPTRYGYKFKNWAADIDGTPGYQDSESGNLLSNYSTVAMDRSYDLHSIWWDAQNDVNYDNIFSFSEWATSNFGYGVWYNSSDNKAMNLDAMKVDPEAGTVTLTYDSSFTACRSNFWYDAGLGKYSPKLESDTDYIFEYTAKTTSGTATAGACVYVQCSSHPTGKADLYPSITANTTGVTNKYTFNSGTGNTGVWIRFDNNTKNSTITFSDVKIYKASDADKINSITYPNTQRAYGVTDIANLQTPVRPGYKFEGWYTDAACTVAATQADLAKSVTVYSKWSDVPFDVNYDNIFSFSDWADGAKLNYGTDTTLEIDAQNGTVRVVDNNSSSDDIYTNYGNGWYTMPVKPSTSYTFEFDIEGLEGSETAQFFTFYYQNEQGSTAALTTHSGWRPIGASTATSGEKVDANGHYTSTFTTPDNCNYIGMRMGTYTDGADITFKNIAFYETANAEAIADIDNREIRDVISGDLNLYTPVRPGYTFLGWYDADGNKIDTAAATASQKSLSLTSKWTVNSYKVLFDNLFDYSKFTIGGNLTVNEKTDTGFTVTSTAGDGNTGFSYAIPVEPGKTYILSADAEFVQASGGYDVYIQTLNSSMAGETSATPDTTNGAHREGNVYISLTGQTGKTPYIKFTAGDTTAYIKIRFDANAVGNKLTINNIRLNEVDKVADGISYHLGQDVTFDATYGTLPSPTKTGYTFKSWTLADGTGVTKDTVVATASNHTLYSTWTANKYAVVFNANGGSGTMANQTHTYDTALALTANAYTKTGYTFTGWNTKADGTGTAYTDKQSVKNLVASGSFVLYAQWKANTYTVKFNANGGSGTMADQTITYDVSTALTANAFTRTGYTFKGWSTDKSATAATYTNKQAVKNLAASGSVTLYAVWGVNSYTVTFVNAAGTTVSTKSYDYGTAASAVTKPANTAANYDETNHYAYSWPTISAVTGDKTYNEVKTATKHTMSSKVTTAATCTTDGVRTYTCSGCAYSYTEKIAATGHAYTSKVTTAATCTTDGVRTYTCSNDNSHTYTEAIAALGHTFGATTAAKVATCLADGNAAYKQCSTCKKYFAESAAANSTQGKDSASAFTKAQLAHSYTGAIKSDGNGKTATHSFKCVNGCSNYGGAVTHTWNSGSVTTAATCITGGTKTYTCTADGCGATYTEAIAAKGHVWGTTTAYKAATCTEAGNNAYKQCTVCNLYFAGDAATTATDGKADTSSFVIAKKAHSYTGAIKSDGNGKTATHSYKCVNGCNEYGGAVTHTWNSGSVTTAATCTTNGVKTYTCTASGCGATYTETIAATGHNFGDVTKANAATCTEAGNEAYKQCTVCKKYFAENAAANATDGKADTSSFVIAKLGHDYADDFTVDTKATCTADGSKSKHCSRCSSKTDVTVIAKRGHTLEDTTVKTAATCLAAGEMNQKCTNAATDEYEACSYTTTREIAQLAHSYTGAIKSDGNGKDATHSFKCVNGCDGYGAAEKHTWNDGVIDPDSTCITGGVKTYTCTASGCGATYTEDVAAKGHTFGATTAYKAATCTEAGNKAYKQCTVCNLYFAGDAATTATDGKADTTSFVIAKLGHDYADDFTVDTKATCTADGSKSKHCSRCSSKTDVTVIAKRGHTLVDDGVAKAATCLAAGEMNQKCTNAATDEYEACSYTTTREIAQLNHSYTGAIKSDGNGKDATHSFKCVNGCDKYGAAVKHTWNDGEVTTDPTCIKEGVKTYTCTATDCGATYTEAVAIDSDNHENTEDKAKQEPTCTEVGYTAGTYCNDCKKWISGHEEIEALDHNWSAWTEVTPATCLAAGEEKRTCQRADCDAFETQAIAQLAHSYTGKYKWDSSAKTHAQQCVNGCNEYNPTATACTFEAVVTAPTCYVNGYTTYTCTVCKNNYQADYTTREHVYVYAAGDGTSHEVTCEYDNCDYTATENCSGGTAYCNALAVCKNCNTEWGSLDKDNHASTETYVTGKTDNNCGVAGYTGDTYHKCCDALKEKGTEIPATGNHTYGAFAHDDGKATHSKACSVCGDTVTEDCTAGDWITDVNATCMETGSKHKECTVCGYTMQTEAIPTIAHSYGGNAVNKVDGKHHYQCQNILNTGNKCAEYGNEEACSGGTATCEAKAVCAKCNTVYGDALGHKDANTDHVCDNGCGVAQGTHEDTNNDHKCEYGCSEAIGTCADTDLDHACDYGCDKVYGDCEDTDLDHACDYGCNKVYGTCEDTDLDHACDYGCDKVYGDCEDKDLDHACDYGCDKAYGTCEDKDLDHACDYGCDKAYGTCEDTDLDHACDYGCDKAYGACEDKDLDHKCDYGCNKVYGTCEDKDLDHKCDYGCDKSYGTHADNNKDHSCDYGCKVAIGTCEDKDYDHACDYGCDKSYGTHADNNKDHSCDYGCKVAIGTCEDENKNHTCDYGCGQSYGTHEDTDKNHTCDYGCSTAIGDCEDNNKDHTCDYGCGKSYGEHEDSADDDDHVCDYGCGEVLEECADGDDNNHSCDICGKEDISEHVWVDADCTTPKTCSICGATDGEATGHDYVGVVTTEPTCTEKGEKTFTCQNDANHTYKEDVAPLGHIDDDNNGFCDRCGALICDHKDQGTHVTDDKKETCTEDGYTGDTRCNKCNEITELGSVIPALGHKDENKDHVCDNGCGVAQGTHEDKNTDHACDYGCSESMGTCEDTDLDHTCDYGCDVYYGEHKDENTDHACDYGCKVAMGTCEDADKDHDCDYGCDKTYGTCEDKNLDHKCDYGCAKAYGTCEDKDLDHGCDYGCDKIYGTCGDADRDHACDYGCDQYYGAHEDKNTDHACDYGCKVAMSTCEDADKDHDCDYGCDKTYGTCEDADKDHACDYGCDKIYGTCEDTDKDHDCDYGCDKYYGTHEDTNTDHACDYGCKVEIGTCEDADKDHDCDYGCDKYYGTHADSDKNHTCDYGCEETIGDCEDTDLDHNCDYGCDKTYGTCEDKDLDHACDYGCDKAYGTCEDADLDHDCDYGCDKTYGTCEDADKDHACDYGCDKYFGEHKDSADDDDHVCDYGCGEVLEECVDTDNDHACDNGCDKYFGEHKDSADDKDHVCDYGCGEVLEECVDTDKDHDCDNGCDKYFGEHKDSADDDDHVCDYGCGAVLEECADGDDNNHNCDICGKEDVSDHKYDAVVTAPTCTEDGYTTYTCSECGHAYTDDEVAAIGHAWADTTYTWTEDGKSCTAERICNNDGTHKETAIVSATSKVKTAATCEEDGWTTYTATFTTEWVTEQTKDVQDIPAIGHAWGEWKHISGSCVEEAVYERVCANDASHTQQEIRIGGEHEVPVNDKGEPIYDTIVAPNCTQDGFYAYSCAICDADGVKITVATEGYEEELKKTGHKWIVTADTDAEGWIVDDAATCNRDGSKYRVCEYCSAADGCHNCDGVDPNGVQTGTISKTGHSDKNGDGTCDSCGVTLSNRGGNCGCICHKDNWFMRILYKILRFFWKLFKISKSCDCGFVHY